MHYFSLHYSLLQKSLYSTPQKPLQREWRTKEFASFGKSHWDCMGNQYFLKAKKKKKKRKLKNKAAFEMKKPAFTKTLHSRTSPVIIKKGTAWQNGISAGAQPFPSPSLKASQPHQQARTLQIHLYKFKQHNSTLAIKSHTYTASLLPLRELVC